MQYDFDEIIDRDGTDATKYEACAALNAYLPPKCIPLWVADMDFACASPILDAIRRRLDRRILGYSTIDYDMGYKDSVVRWMQRRFDWRVQPDWIAFSAGIVPSFYAAIQLLTIPGEAVLVMTPAYNPFESAITAFGRTPLYSPLIETDGYYTIDWDDFTKKAARKDCKLFFLCSPHNPTGRVWTEEELVRMGEICFANDVIVIDDEIHADLVRTGACHIPLGRLFPEERRIVTCTSPSKTFNIAGNRHANLIIPDAALREKFMHNAYMSHPGALSIDAAKAAYNECEDWLTQLKLYLDGTFDAVAKLLAKELPQATFRIPEGTYLAWVDFSALGMTEDELNRRVSQAGVFIQFGKDFVNNADCHARINLASPRSVVLEGMRRICEALKHSGAR